MTAVNLALGSFGGEDFLQVKLPNHSQDRFLLTVWIIAATVLWFFIFPFFFAETRVSTVETQVQVPVVEASKGQKKSKNLVASNSETKVVQEKVSTRSIPLYITVFVCAGYLATLLWLAMTQNPSNYFSARRVFQAPLFTAEECQRIMDMSAAAAQRNYERAIDDSATATTETTTATARLNKTLVDWRQEPVGWHKTRHGNYPTTDLNLVTDPFDRTDLAWLGDLLDRRLAPTLSRIYGVPAGSIRANDMFVVRYDSDQRRHLANHTDDADISFNILLNDNFTGGGTRFWNRIEQAPFGHVQPVRPGQFLTHTALLNHEGYPVESGTRMIFVGFLSVDRKDPFSQTPTGMSWCSSWFSLPWMHVKFKEGYHVSHSRLDRNEGRATKWADNMYARSFFLDMANLLEAAGDLFSAHVVENLVPESVADEYLAALDQAAVSNGESVGESGGEKASSKANWFHGQQLNLDIDGTIDSEWRTRSENADRFSEL